MLNRLLSPLLCASLVACGPSGSAAPGDSVEFGESGDLGDALADHLLRLDAAGKPVPAELGPEVERFVFYFSAHWCAACRVLTPELVEWYQQNHDEKSNWELVFVSRDRSAEAMAEYMHEENMPWLALDFDTARNLPLLDPIRPQGLPATALVSLDGKVLAHSYDFSGTYQSPVAALEALHLQP